MQHVENDMDDLFRKAAENYSLKTESQNWDDIAAVLATTSVPTASDKKGKKKYTWLLLLGFLFLASTVTIKIFYTKNQGPYPESITTNSNKETTIAEGNIKQGNSETNRKKIASKDLIVLPGDTKYKNVPGYKSAGQVATLTKSNQEQALTENKEVRKINITKPEVSDTGESANNDIHAIVPTENPIAQNIDIDRSADQKNKKSVKSTVSDSILKNHVVSPEPKKRKSAINEQGLYLGITAGPQVNQVKGQGFTQIGFSTGILTGYRFTKEISVETGILYSKKHYFSDGKYFDMSKTGSTMPVNMNVISLKGSSDIFEIPLEFKYDFVAKNKSNWFITSGVSSYLLTKESNEYLTLISGVLQNMNTNYASNRGYFLATLNFSIGNELKIGNNQSKIRIEPYLQMPIHGIGIGAMPVYSVGLHLGITMPVKK